MPQLLRKPPHTWQPSYPGYSPLETLPWEGSAADVALMPSVEDVVDAGEVEGDADEGEVEVTAAEEVTSHNQRMALISVIPLDGIQRQNGHSYHRRPNNAFSLIRLGPQL